ncbi:EamA family transporter [Nostoc sp. 'Lobaria pulmonaria (5183) cyanobiont']|uniref:EamA family transporter n=1 Tax=Nostoc sp. 'Lobaria pulmonaria (5183) cyanobiont' TaxID=1618022 RepID=UPI000CF33B3B|nr:EamA family transporter [Nostoc sp. 'Lobaria pulmonaria (5183) cyanobiont']AVH71839.1 drug/metabolite transporter (DMT) superfamily permease [Nostoc sp. 'Lobaria pulmonaria (5183) cyanobiont']
MGRFEKQPENPRVRGELSRAAENALWAVVEDLENLQQNVLRALQEDVKRLQSEKNRLSDEIQSLVEEKEHLQQVRQITEQQVLIRQLAEVLAKHISSQLQSSLATLANQSIEGKSYEQAALKSAEVSSNVVGEINEKVEHMFDSLDDTVTVTFNSLQQELKNYQSNLSQQLSRMYSQQQQGETILTEFVNRLHGELDKTIEETSRKSATAGIPTVLQFTEPEKNSSVETSLPEFEQVVRNSLEPISPISNKFSPRETTSQPPIIKENTANPISSPSKDLSPRETTSKPPIVKENTANPISSPSKDLSPRETTSESPIVKENTANPISSPSKDLSSRETPSEPTAAVVPPPKDNATEPISVLNQESPENETKSEPSIASLLQPRMIRPSPKDPNEPIAVRRKNVSQTKAESSSTTALEPQVKAKPSQSRSPNSSSSSTLQIGLLLIVLSAVISSLYNVAIKVIFHEGSQIFGVLDVEQLLPPTLGNTLLILTLRFMVVVPLMVLLSPILHPRLWQDLENLSASVRGNATPANAATKQILVLSIVSGCFLFLSQVLIYIAIAQVTTGMAIALFFIYPMVSGLFSWFLFRDRPTLFRIAAIAAICCGELLVLGGSPSIGIGNTSMGSSTAILSGVAFAAYIILTRVCASKLHPVTFTLINFTTMLLLSFICLMLPLPSSWNLVIVDPSKILELVLSAFILGVLTLAGYLLNNVGISKLGASRSALIGGSIPVLTVIFAGLIIQENLDIVQILGVLFVTFGAAAFSFETMRNQVKPSNPTN